MRPLVLIAAVSDNYVIGNKGKLPWNLPTDLKRFRRLTRGYPMIMGRTTYDSIGYPLPHRHLIVLSRDSHFLASLPPSVFGTTDLISGLHEANRYAEEYNVDSIFVAGGGHIYTQTLPLSARLCLTWVHKTVTGDTFFPKFDPSQFDETYREAHSVTHEDNCAFTFVDYQRRDTSCNAAQPLL
jgi:dihydrofolate reductase